MKEIQFKSEESISTKVSLHRVKSVCNFVHGFSQHIKKRTYFTLNQILAKFETLHWKFIEFVILIKPFFLQQTRPASYPYTTGDSQKIDKYIIYEKMLGHFKTLVQEKILK